MGLLHLGEGICKSYKFCEETGRSVPERRAEEWRERAYDLFAAGLASDLLTEVDRWTRFIGCFTHIHHNEPAKDKAVLLSAVLVDATNQGLTTMADACPGRSITITALEAEYERG